MSDNGFGAQVNSPDYVLRVYRISPDFRTSTGGIGHDPRQSRTSSCNDPDRKINFPIVADGSSIPAATIPVDPAIKSHRLLTGGDFDIESMRVAPDGTFWFGDEFGPFLLHTDANGKMLEAPIPLPGRAGAAESVSHRRRPTCPRAGDSKGWRSRPTAGRSIRCWKAR